MEGAVGPRFAQKNDGDAGRVGTRRWGRLLLGVATACSSTTPPDAAGPAVDGSDAGTSATAPEACITPVVTFHRSPITIAPARDHHATFIHDVAGVPWLYVVGGAADDFATVHTDVQRARIRDDGELEAFESAGTIPRGRAGHAVAVVGEDVVLLGGIVGIPRTGFTDETLVARFDVSGRLDAWSTGPKLPRAVQHATAVVASRDVYVFGGTTGSDATDDVGRITVAEDGSLGDYVPLPKLPGPRSHHASFLANGSVYHVGGLDRGALGNPPSRSDVIRAPLEANGALGAWETAGTLPNPLSVSAVEPVGCSFLFAGGLEDEKDATPYTDRVLVGSLREDGTFQSDGAREGRLTIARAHVHQTPHRGAFLYSVGGRDNRFDAVASIDIGHIEP
jgi:hypothetical protein